MTSKVVILIEASLKTGLISFDESRKDGSCDELFHFDLRIFLLLVSVKLYLNNQS